MHRANRRGVTLIEVFAVVIVLGMVIAVLVPIISVRRMNQRRDHCLTNLRQVAMAATNYDSSQQTYPGFRNPPLYRENVSWAPTLFPYFCSRYTYDAMKSGEIRGVYWPGFVCPSNPPQSTRRESTPLAYVANSGRFNSYPRRACDGVFLDQVPSDADPANPEPVKVSAAYITAHDGLSSTLMFAERLYWYPATSSPPTPTDGDYRLYDNESVPTQEGRVAFSWLTPAGAKVSDHISSRHGDGANAVFCDSRATFMSNSIDYEVYQQLMTPNGAEAGVTKAINPTEF